MNEIVKASIEGRKQAFFNAYEINDKELVSKINDLFIRITEFGKEHEANFETDFLSSSLNKEYIDLFTLVASKCKPKVYETTNNVKSDREYLQEELASETRYQARELTLPARRKIREEATSKARDLPIIGDALNVKQHVDFFSKFTKKNK